MPPSIPTIPRDSSPRRSALRVGVALGAAIVSVVAIVVVVFYAASPPADISPTPDTSTNTAKMNSSGRQNGSSSRDTTPATAKSGRAATLSDRRDADWRKIDNPGGDGWETEVFHSRAKKQLGKLAELLASGDAVAAEKLSPLLASDFSCSALRPETLQTAFNESGLYVQRGASSDAKAFRTVDGLREALQRQMSSLGPDSPYVMVLDPPDDYPKLRRHKHPRYSFKPLLFKNPARRARGGQCGGTRRSRRGLAPFPFPDCGIIRV